MEKEWQQLKECIKFHSERAGIPFDLAYIHLEFILKIMERLEACKSLTDNGYGPTL